MDQSSNDESNTSRRTLGTDSEGDWYNRTHNDSSVSEQSMDGMSVKPKSSCSPSSDVTQPRHIRIERTLALVPDEYKNVCNSSDNCKKVSENNSSSKFNKGECSQLSLNLSPESLGPTRLLPALDYLPLPRSINSHVNNTTTESHQDCQINPGPNDAEGESSTAITPHVETETSFSSPPFSGKKSISFDVFDQTPDVATEAVEHDDERIPTYFGFQ